MIVQDAQTLQSLSAFSNNRNVLDKMANEDVQSRCGVSVYLSGHYLNTGVCTGIFLFILRQNSLTHKKPDKAKRTKHIPVYEVDILHIPSAPQVHFHRCLRGGAYSVLPRLPLALHDGEARGKNA